MRKSWLSTAAVLLAAALSGCSPGAPATPAHADSPTTPPPTAAPAPPPTAAPAPPSPAPAPATLSPTSAPATQGLSGRPIGSVEGAPLGYVEYLPPSSDPGQRPPLLVFLHGAGEAGDGSEEDLGRVTKLGIPQLIQEGSWPAERPFVVLMPQYSSAKAEGECELADEVASFLAWAIAHYEIDPERVYATGVSCGAIGLWDYLGEHGDNDSVAAAVLIAGHLEWSFPTAGCELGRVPVWVFHGEEDEIVPVSYVVDRIDELRACTSPAPVEVRLTTYPGADHDSWTQTYDLSAGHDIYAWLLEH